MNDLSKSLFPENKGQPGIDKKYRKIQQQIIQRSRPMSLTMQDQFPGLNRHISTE